MQYIQEVILIILDGVAFHRNDYFDIMHPIIVLSCKCDMQPWHLQWSNNLDLIHNYLEHE